MSGKRWGPQKPFSCVVREMAEWAAQRGCEYDNPGWNTAQGEPGTRSATHFNCWALYLRDIQQNSSTLGGNEEGDVERGRPTAAAADSIEGALKALTGGFSLESTHADGAVSVELFKWAWTCSQRRMRQRTFHRHYITWINERLKALNATFGSSKMLFYPHCSSTQTPHSFIGSSGGTNLTIPGLCLNSCFPVCSSDITTTDPRGATGCWRLRRYHGSHKLTLL